MILQPDDAKFCSRSCYKEWKGTIPEQRIRQYWSGKEPIIYKKEKYRVGRMSYGDFFLEPYNEEYPEGRGEQFPFAKGTLWLKRHPFMKELLYVDKLS